jgi:hypothetical protein
LKPSPITALTVFLDEVVPPPSSVMLNSTFTLIGWPSRRGGPGGGGGEFGAAG